MDGAKKLQFQQLSVNRSYVSRINIQVKVNPVMIESSNQFRQFIDKILGKRFNLVIIHSVYD